MVYGSLINRGQVTIKNVVITVEASENIIYYKRTRDNEVEREMMIKAPNLFLVPYPPVLLPEKGLYNHLMIELNKELVIYGGLEVGQKIKIPIDLATITDIKNPYNIVDLFSVDIPKMAVYGKVQEGLLVRYLKTTNREEASATVNLHIKNCWERTVTFSRVVFASNAFFLCFKENSWISIGPTIKICIKEERNASVEVLPPQCPEGYLLISSSEGKVRSEPYRFEMINGFSKGG